MGMLNVYYDEAASIDLPLTWNACSFIAMTGKQDKKSSTASMARIASFTQNTLLYSPLGILQLFCPYRSCSLLSLLFRNAHGPLVNRLILLASVEAPVTWSPLFVSLKPSITLVSPPAGSTSRNSVAIICESLTTDTA